MLRNYLKIALRRLLRDRTFTLLNLAGLAVGLAAFLLLFEYIAHEWSANRFHRNYDHLYRLVESSPREAGKVYMPPGYKRVIQENFGGIRDVVRVAEGIGAGVLTTVGPTPQAFREERISFSDGDFFRAFTFPLVAGTNTLDQPQTLALSATLARKLFGTERAVGKSLKVSNQFGTTLYTVTGVFADFPANSDLQAEVILALSTLNSRANRSDNDWADPATMDSEYANLYVFLDERTDPDALARQLTQFYHASDPKAKDRTLHLQPFRHLHLAPSFGYPFQTFGSFPLVVSLAGVALLVLLIAWINYVNLSTAQSLRKAREVGVRRVVGAQRRQLVGQFLVETGLLTAAGLLLGILLTFGLQSFFNEFTGKALFLTVLRQSGFWALLLGVIGGTAVASGAYVALLVSSFNPSAVLRSRLTISTRRFSLRQGLVVFQFGISVLFIVATLVMFRQLSFMRNSALGLNLNQLLVLEGPTVATDQQSALNAAFKQELSQLPFVRNVAASNNVPGVGYNFGTEGITRPNPVPGDEKKQYRMFIADQNFFATYGIPLAQGRPFTQAEAEASWNNAPKVIVNQRAARQLGYDPKNLVAGQKLLWASREYEIVGVVNDYHHLSMHQAIDPVIYLPSVAHGFFTIRTDADRMPQKLATLEALYKKSFPGNPFEYFFADEAYDRQFRTERQLGQVFVASSLVAILIACLGIFGLAAFAAQQRTKEIGVRKVLGASVGSIVALLSRDFLKLVLAAIVVASPLAWWGANRWLEDFAYRVEVGWGVFVLAGSLALLIALLTVSFQSVKAALMNPVKSLRNE
jgi:putative ABC transport system permease protein